MNTHGAEDLSYLLFSYIYEICVDGAGQPWTVLEGNMAESGGFEPPIELLVL